MLLLSTAAAGQTANLAVLWRRENGAMSMLWDQVSCAAVLAVNHFNARDGRIVPEFATGKDLTDVGKNLSRLRNTYSVQSFVLTRTITFSGLIIN